MNRTSTFSATDLFRRTGRLAYYARWYAASLAGRRSPIIATMVLHERCNLSCLHCAAGNGESSMPLRTAGELIRSAAAAGARVLFFEGGEPLLWRDGDAALPELIRLGREAGFFSIGYTTNGTLPIVPGADVVSVSLDGPEAVHDRIRGAGSFALLKKNLEEFVPAPGATLFANAVICRENFSALEDIGPAAAALPHLSGVLYNVVTPPTAAGLLSRDERARAAARLRELSRKGSAVLNTPAGLAALAEPDLRGRCPSWMSVFYLPGGGTVRGCPLAADPASCAACGFAAPREWNAMLALRIGSALSLARRFAL